MSRRQILKLAALASAAAVLPRGISARASLDQASQVAVSQPDQLLRVLSYNVWGVPTSTQRPARMTAIGRTLASMNLDIVGLQECWLEADRERILSGLAGSDLRYTHFYAAGVMGSGLMLLSRFPIIDVGFHRYSLNGQPLTYPEVDHYGGKGIGYAALDTPFGEIAVFNTHIIAQYGSDEDDLFFAHRAAQAYEFARYVNVLADGRPVIAMGDFNLNPGKLGYQVVDALGRFDNSYESVHGANEHFRGLIDHVFVRDGLAPTTVGVSPLAPPQGSSLDRLSDHPAVIVELTPNADAPRPDFDPAGISEILRDLLDLLERGISAAEKRVRGHDVRAGISLAAFMGAETSSDELQFYRPLWGRLLRLSGVLAALPLAVGHGWLGSLVGFEEITTLHRFVQEVRVQLDRYL